MSFCLPTEFVNKFIDALKSGAIDPEKLSKMTSADRREYLGKIVGEADAREVNALFESKLLLKNQKAGMVSWAKQVAGLSERTKADIVSQIEKLDRVLSPEQEQAFLEDLASKKLGTDVTYEEARQIAELSKAAVEARDKVKPTDPIGSQSRIDYGAAKMALQNKIDELKVSNAPSLKDKFKEGGVGKGVGATAKEIASISKGMQSSLDNSALFRQGWKTVFTHPDKWANNAVASFVNIAKQLRKSPNNSSVLDGIKAEIYGRPNAMNNMYTKMKLDIGEFEEAYPTKLPEKIPLFGRLYKTSETAYTGFLYKMRADIADKYIDIAQKNGVNLADSAEVQSIGRLVNSLTGRGNLGNFEKVGREINTFFFSPKLLKAQVDFLTAHQLRLPGEPPMSSFGRKQAALNIVKVAAGMATILATAKALNPESVEFDPKSADFGKIRIGNTRFDVSGGMSSIITLAARMLTQESKSSVTGKITPLNSGKYGAPTSLDTLVDFFTNKASPIGQVLVDYLRGQTFQGEKPTIGKEALNLITPIPIKTSIELLTEPGAAPYFIAALFDGLGISTNTYGKKK